MNWPKFETEYAVAGSEELFGFIASEKLIKPSINDPIKGCLLKLKSTDLFPDGGYIYHESWITFFLSEDILNVYSNGENQKLFAARLAEFYEMFSKMYEGKEDFTALGSTFNFYYQKDNGDILMFPLQLNILDQLVSRTELILKTIAGIINGNERVILEAISKVFVQTNRIFYLLFNGKEFELKNPLQEVSDRYNKRYIENTDKRVSKPDFILHEENLNKKFTFGNNWILTFDGLETMMIRPNDVAIYADICKRQLNEAQIFYRQTIIPRHEKYFGSFPSKETQVKYYDFFELITTALIFSITAIEAFVNSLIPEKYTFTTATGKVRDKYHIERYLSLFDKMREHLTIIYKTDAPEQQPWWKKFIELEELRNQTIHTKQHLSEDRYSKLLGKEIFSVIEVYKDVISFYGPYLRKDRSKIINELPYGFDFDDVRPSLITDKNYRKLYNNLHNPHNPL